jgi:hypothetical protein
MLYLLIPSLFAFAPNLNQGIEPQRIYSQVHHTYQRHLQQQMFWQTFLEDSQSDWDVRFDEVTGYPLRAIGKGISFGNRLTKEDLLEQSNLFVSKHESLFHPKELSTPQIAFNHTRQAYFVHYDQRVLLHRPIYNNVHQKEISSIKVYRSGVDLFIDTQNQSASMTMFGVELYDHVNDQVGASYIQASDAIAIAIEDGPITQQDSVPTDIDIELLFVPFEKEKESLQIPLCWKISFSTESPVGQWQIFVDAQSGEIHSVHNEVRFFTGALQATYEERNPNSDVITGPLEDLKISTDTGTIYTDSEGEFTLEESSTIDDEILLRGVHTRIFNSRGTEVILDIDTQNQNEITEENIQIFDVDSFLDLENTNEDMDIEEEQELILSQLNQYMYQSHIYNWAETYAERVINNWPRSDINVNLDDVCNAYFDGELNFFRQGEGCNNTGRIADVSYHEWGHGFHYHNLLSGVYDGSVSEGLSDVVAFLQTGDAKISPYFYVNGGHIREVSRNRVYPDDIVNEVHTDGLIFAGAVWDLWNLLIQEYPEENTDILTRIFVEATSMGPEIATSYEAFLFADDDDGDLSNGTPHQCLLIEAFGDHGLGPKGQGGFYELEHTPISNQTSSSSIDIQVQVEQLASNCIDASVASTKVYFSTDQGSSWEEQELSFSLEENSITGQFPDFDDHTHVLYYIEITDTEERIARIPSGGIINPFEFFVGDISEIYCNDFELDDGDFGHVLVDGRDREGADDWMRGMLAGLGGDPEFSYSGDYAWGNDLGGEINGENYNGQYQNEKHNRLYTPSFDTSQYDHVVVSFQRWLHVEDGFYDQARILVNEETMWENHATRSEVGEEHHQDYQWQQQIIHVQNIDDVSVAWEIESDAGLTMGGWTIDDFCLYGYNDPDPEEPPEEGCNCSYSTSHDMNSSSWFILVILGLFVQTRRKRNF